MPTKQRIFDTNLYYHVYNCGVEKRLVFDTDRDYARFLDAANYYLYDQGIGYARFQELVSAAQQLYLLLHPKGVEKLWVRLLSYCLMPNHFHFLLKPAREDGITRFISDISNSYTRYFNTKNERIGVLFQGSFKAKEISSEESLLQVSRYIHLNPAVVNRNKFGSAAVIRPEDYPFSSFQSWMAEPSLHPKGVERVEIDREEVSGLMNLVGGADGYKKFVEAKMETKPEAGIEDLVLE